MASLMQKILFTLAIASNLAPADAGNFLKTIDCFLSVVPLIPFVLNYQSYEDYSTYFREDSVFRFPQAGVYVGPDDIAEYVSIVDSDFNPFGSEGADISFPFPQYVDYDADKDQCVFRLFAVVKNRLNATLVQFDQRTKTTIMFKFHIDRKEKYAAELKAYFYPGLVQYQFGIQQNTDAAREFVCSVANGPACAPYMPQNVNCFNDLAALPMTEGDLHYIDGNSQVSTGVKLVEASCSLIFRVGLSYVTFCLCSNQSGESLSTPFHTTVGGSQGSFQVPDIGWYTSIRPL